jgi:uracil-DNA glycosylase
MDARDELRRLLRQRLEDGESTIVLDSLTASQVANLCRPEPVRRFAPQGELGEGPPSQSGSGVSPEGRGAPLKTTPRETLEERRAAAPTGSGDWRAALRSTEQEMPPPKTAALPRTGKVVVTPDAPLPPMNSLVDVRAAVAGCTRCALYASALNPVPGEGNHTADFMVVGEAPGQTEDEQGKPFVGRAGQLLTQILEAIDLKRDEVFICNVLKHRPPGNRNPEPDEVKACSPYLIRQIELIKPKVILALGTFSAQTLLNTKTAIGKLRGQVHEYHGVPVVVTYHPAALLRNPAWKRPTWEDVQLARRILDSAPPRGS